MTTPAKSPAEMTDDELRIAIAEWCGWKRDTNRQDLFRDPKYFNLHELKHLPNYPADLNAMWDSEETLKPERNATETTPWGKYFLLGLLRFAERNKLPVGHLTAKHKAIVFVETIQNLQYDSRS